MRILRLRFKNIHSLKGPQIIDFTVPPLSLSGLFAITGPTGAGKSTILDVITLALFNKIPRFSLKGTESISKNDIEKTGSVLTHFMDEAYAEIEYECHGRAYRSTWSISKGKKGNLRDYDMCIALLPQGQLLDLKKSQVPDENEKILGLKYDQFIRAILLSQGDFARLLKSDDKDRAKLLEDITGTQIYRVIGRKIFDLNKQNEEDIRIFRQQLALINVLPEDAIKEKIATIQTNQSNIQKINDEVKIFTATLQKYENFISLTKKINDTKAAQLHLDQRIQGFQPNENKLTKHRHLEKYKSNITLWQNETTRLTDLKVQFNNFAQSIQTAELTVNQSLENISQLVRKKTDHTNCLESLKQFENTIKEIDRQLNQLEQKGINQRDVLNNLLDGKEFGFIAELKKTKGAEQQAVIAEKQKKNLIHPKISANLSDTELKVELRDTQEKIMLLQKKYNDAKRLEELQNDINTLQKQDAEEKLKLINVRNDYDKISAELNDLKAKQSALLSEKEFQLTVANLEEHRTRLKHGEPCPLCGAIDHPYALQELFSGLGQLELKIVKNSDDIQSKEKNHQYLQTRIAVSSATIEKTLEQMNTANTKMLEISEKWEIPLPASDLLSYDYESKKTDYNSLLSEDQRRIELDVIIRILDILQELIETGKTYKQAKNHRASIFTGDDVALDVAKIQTKYLKARDDLQTQTITAQNINNSIAQTTNKIYDLTSDLEKELFALGYANISEVFADILDELTYEKLVNEKQLLTKENTELNKTLEYFLTEIEEFNMLSAQAVNPEELQMQIIGLNTEKDKMHQANGAIKNELTQNEELVQKQSTVQSHLTNKEKDAGPMMHLCQLIGDATGSKYAKFAQNLSLRHLIILANKRLSHLTDRYLLVPTDIEDDLRIMDLYQGSITRSVKTLSGGETFMVSLALALSLADMASKNVQLQSLFIDEGFGTLDNETLETAIVTLEKLQSEGNRTIGVISHVDSLKERITTQIKVHKNNLGYSTIEIV
jgi:exonuclease SbcC